MDQFTDALQSILNSKGFLYSLMVLLIVVLTEVIKSPVKKRIEAYAKETSKPKQKLTFYFALLPLALAVIFVFIYYSWKNIGWDYSKFSYAGYFAEVGTFYVASEGLYVIVETIVKKIKSGVVSSIGDPTGLSFFEVVKKYNKAQKDEKAQAKVRKAEARNRRISEAKAKRIEELKRELEGLQTEEEKNKQTVEDSTKVL